MNIPITASRLIDRAILLEEGGAIVVPCSSYEEMESLRIRLYKLKRQLTANFREAALSLDIKRKVGTDRWTIFITKDTSLSGVFVVEGGEAKPFEDSIEVGEEIREEVVVVEKEIKEEEKEIEEEKDFDDVAAEMEVAQGLLKEEDTEMSKITIS